MVQRHSQNDSTDPPLNAPTGFFTGGATASCSRGLVV